ncbi:hypothetical protein MYCTH_2312643 [Thermothelomyces thermophilus ATCC 42464]|uniref:Uncharacterized protein n=1 Tax=Thermothelomyces thermophilus (strain ATCC 42464 / BCRC 31852 / DSM 1799) TaxID=573729 RepID=G2QN24_THET4|nr:uncharacterized protein MYCTH_2312643 [Thermothelomyces thermophilus ATCC 42464]AEO61897.1 hypothetical protein MYCTH_2312643 [Thermothelomyces thermophilus ATCC 42464]
MRQGKEQGTERVCELSHSTASSVQRDHLRHSLSNSNPRAPGASKNPTSPSRQKSRFRLAFDRGLRLHYARRKKTCDLCIRVSK